MLDGHASILLPATVQVSDVAVVGREVSNGETLGLGAGVDAAARLCAIEVGEGEGDLVCELLVAGDALNVQLARALGEEAVGAFVVGINPRAFHTCLNLLDHISTAGICHGFHLRPSMDPAAGTGALHSTRCRGQERKDNARSHVWRLQTAW